MRVPWGILKINVKTIRPVDSPRGQDGKIGSTSPDLPQSEPFFG
jgi:hypothetical protein